MSDKDKKPKEDEPEVQPLGGGQPVPPPTPPTPPTPPQPEPPKVDEG